MSLPKRDGFRYSIENPWSEATAQLFDGRGTRTLIKGEFPPAMFQYTIQALSLKSKKKLSIEGSKDTPKKMIKDADSKSESTPDASSNDDVDDDAVMKNLFSPSDADDGASVATKPQITAEETPSSHQTTPVKKRSVEEIASRMKAPDSHKKGKTCAQEALAIEELV